LDDQAFGEDAANDCRQSHVKSGAIAIYIGRGGQTRLFDQHDVTFQMAIHSIVLGTELSLTQRTAIPKEWCRCSRPAKRNPKTRAMISWSLTRILTPMKKFDFCFMFIVSNLSEQ